MKKILLLLLAILLCGAQPASAQMARFKALFLFNFAQYVAWPDHNNSSDFIITILGDSDIAGELEKLASTRNIDGSRLVVHQATSLSQIGETNIVFLADNRTGELSNLFATKKDKPVLIVGDRQGLCRQGAGLTFLIEDGTLRFEISQKNIESHGLNTSGRLLSLGIRTD